MNLDFKRLTRNHFYYKVNYLWIFLQIFFHRRAAIMDWPPRLVAACSRFDRFRDKRLHPSAVIGIKGGDHSIKVGDHAASLGSETRDCIRHLPQQPAGGGGGSADPDLVAGGEPFGGQFRRPGNVVGAGVPGLAKLAQHLPVRTGNP